MSEDKKRRERSQLEIERRLRNRLLDAHPEPAIDWGSATGIVNESLKPKISIYANENRRFRFLTEDIDHHLMIIPISTDTLALSLDEIEESQNWDTRGSDSDMVHSVDDIITHCLACIQDVLIIHYADRRNLPKWDNLGLNLIAMEDDLATGRIRFRKDYYGGDPVEGTTLTNTPNDNIAAGAVTVLLPYLYESISRHLYEHPLNSDPGISLFLKSIRDGYINVSIYDPRILS